MKFATFNLYQFLAPNAFWYEHNDYNTYKPHEWEQKQLWITQRLQQMNADVVGFQEVFSVAALKTLCQQAGYEHFITVDEPRSDDTHPDIYINPVVALASRYPIIAEHPIPIPDEVHKHLPIQADFRFSRLPICVTVATDTLAIRVYVVHLKSKRPIESQVNYSEDLPWQARIQDTMKRLSRGNIAALLQRGVEATLLYHHISDALHQQAQLPIIVLGDLNDDQYAIPLSALMMDARIYAVGGVDYEDWPQAEKQWIHHYRLSDSFHLADNMRQRTRPHTHIYRGQGTVLDYILVSNSLNNRNPEARAEVGHFTVLHDHLDNDGIPNRLQSDHGQVVVNINLVKDEAHLPNPEAHKNPRLLEQTPPQAISHRDDFITLAGGIYQSHKHYNQWKSEDKYEHFWAFFFDTDHGWVKSIYGLIPVEELHQKQRHSIEHIIPRIFLDEYFANKAVPRNVRNGATGNPFNLAPADRNINAKRSSFPFAMRKGAVKRPDNLSLHPESYNATGMNADHEWVIPTRNRGDIARAILYMVLTYGIDELYNQHLDVLVHWAKVDTPSAWELAYNEWVFQKHGIRNPFIDTPEKARLLLDNRALMQCTLFKHSSNV